MGAVLYTLLFLMQVASIYSIFPKINFKCNIWDSACSTKMVQSSFPGLTSGIQEINTAVLDPLVLNHISFDIAGLKMDVNNLYIRGLKDGTFDSLSIDPISREVKVSYHVNLDGTARYNAGGNLLGLPFFGSGFFRIQPRNLQFEVVMPFDIVKDSYGRHVVDLKGFNYSFDVKDHTRFDFTNLFYGNRAWSDAVHNFVNSNSRLVTSVYGSGILDAVNTEVFKALRTYLLANPIENVFLLDKLPASEINEKDENKEKQEMDEKDEKSEKREIIEKDETDENKTNN
ncbi:protein takeout-like [Leptidea sinapis]|uniref:protein takeout-like n=1 Tax=Leptidea sinapis TaxID=189913 RepID=UPI0021C340FD|nr:protein takeout-like [Leptidea sinapis]